MKSRRRVSRRFNLSRRYNKTFAKTRSFLKQLRKHSSSKKQKGGRRRKSKKNRRKRRRHNQKGGMVITDMLLNTYRTGANTLGNTASTMQGYQPYISNMPEHQPLYHLDRVRQNTPVRRDTWNQ